MNLCFAITMRVMTKQYPSGTIEAYDALSQDWGLFFVRAFPGCTYLLLPNTLGMAKSALEQSSAQALILSGGDDWGKFPERDATEFALLKWAVSTGMPVLGVCRGMQVINLFYGGSLMNLPGGHVGTRHELHYSPHMVEYFSHEVNSFHSNGIYPDCLAPPLIPLAEASDGSIEAIQHSEKPIMGLMWHPEREAEPEKYDLDLIQKLLSSTTRIFP